jgi:HNH endonuclease
MKPNQAFLLSFFDYDPETGQLWIKPRYGQGYSLTRRLAGYIRKDGYVHVSVLGTSYYAHCIIWCMVTGAWPVYEVDHRDLNRGNNRWENLREATSSQNAFGRRNNNPDRGIEKRGNKFKASIGVRRKKIYLGMFETKEEARVAVTSAAAKYFGKFSRLQ